MSKLINIESKRFEITAKDGISLSAQCIGDSASPPVILLHGFGQHGASWAKVADTLVSKGWRVIIPDLRGHGRSEHSSNDYTLESFNNDLLTLIKNMDQPPVLVGASMGGLLSLFYAGDPLHWPVKKLVLVDITPQWEEKGVKRIMKFMRETSSGFESLQEAAEAIKQYLPHRQEKQHKGLQEYLRQNEAGKWVWHWDPALLDWVEGISSDHIQKKALEAAKRCHVPTLLITGTESDVVSEQGIIELLEALQYGEHFQVSEAGHMIVGDAQDLFTRQIVKFIGSV
ncbi:MAG: alpha/beta fold hydrolase [bacterium]